MEKSISITEESMRFLEDHIPDLADSAFKQAFWGALASGSSVLMCEKDTVVEIFPDGKKKIIKKIAPPTAVAKGQKIVLNE